MNAAAVTIAVFLLTLVLMLTRPRGLHEAWAALIGAVLLLILHAVTWRETASTIAQGADVLLFLLALMILSALLEASGFFDWAAIQAARIAGGDSRALYRNVFALGALTTALLSLDTTAIILTPIVLAFVARLRLDPRPYLVACACVANTGSLLLPVSNLTNLLYLSRYHFGFTEYALRMALPQALGVAVNYAVLRHLLFKRQTGGAFDPSVLPEPASVVPDAPFFRASVAVLGLILIGYFVGSLAHVQPYLIALAGCAVLLVVGAVRRRIAPRQLNHGISWPLFVFVAGLFVVIGGVEKNLALAPLAARLIADAGQSRVGVIFGSAFVAGLGTNIVNNIPAALLAISVLTRAHASSDAVYASLIGCNIGPNLTVVGSLATMLVLESARKRGVEIRGGEFFKAGLVVTPLTLAAACLGLWMTR